MNHSIVLKLGFVFVLLILASGLVVAQDDTRTLEFPDQIAMRRISLTYSQQFAQDAVWQLVPASSDFQTPTGPIPEYTEITFQNYTDAAGWVESGQKLYVYPTVTFPADAAYPFAQQLVNLRDVLAARPNIPDGDLPMLPIVTASQILRAQVDYLDFPGGSGIRYLTAAGLDVSPLSGSALFYTFQGLTNDGAYYIAAVFPVQSSVLPAENAPMTTEQYNAFAANYDTYLADVTQQLNALDPDGFSPSLTITDALLASLQIIEPAATILTPANVETVSASYGGIAFNYAAQLASRVEVDVIPPFVDPGGMAMFGSQPGYTAFTLFDYPVWQPNRRASLRFIPVDTFPQTDTVSDQQLAVLRDFLAARPALSARTMNAGMDSIPVLPVVNAAQVIVAKPEYLDFQNGFGVRFIAYYSQGIEPITNAVIFYKFIGMTADGKVVVSAEFPVMTPVLPEIDYTSLDYDAFAQNYTDYLEATLGSLDAAGGQTYTPVLDMLDNLIRSMNVSG